MDGRVYIMAKALMSPLAEGRELKSFYCNASLRNSVRRPSRRGVN